MLGAIVLIAIGTLLALVLVFWFIGERGRLLRGSTWRMIRQAGMGLAQLHGYVYGRWTRQYVRFLIHRFFPSARPGARQWMSDHYHGKVLTPEQAEAIVNSERDIPLRDLEQIIPYPRARDLVLKGPPDVAAYECACRHARESPCQPTQVCMVIGQPFVDFILEHHPRASRRLSREEALELLRAEHERGHLHSAWFKDALMDRFYAICNCCKCCCGGIEAMTKYGVAMMAASGYVAEIDEELCDACEACIEICPFDAIGRQNGGIRRDWAKCMGCGVCLDQCPREAISLVRDEKKGIPLDVRAMV